MRNEHTDPALSAIMNAGAALYSELERKFFADLHIHRRPLNDCKRQYISAYGITARQFNAIASEAKGKAKAVLENRKAEIESLQDRIIATEKSIWMLEKDDAALARGKGKYKDLAPHERSACRGRVCFLIHMKKRRLTMLNDRLAALKSARKIPSICFGSRRLFHAQWHLEENGYTSHASGCTTGRMRPATPSSAWVPNMRPMETKRVSCCQVVCCAYDCLATLSCHVR